MDSATLLTGLNLTIIGMGIVFVMLELLAELMRLIGKVFPEKETAIGAAKKMVTEVGKAVKPLTDAAKPLTDVATAVTRPLTDVATGVAGVATDIARPLTQAAAEMAQGVPRKDVHGDMPSPFIAAAILHHYRRSRRKTAVNLHDTAQTWWRH